MDIPKLHHSTTDWDFQPGWALDPVIYISVPSSLNAVVGDYGYAICKYPTTFCLPVACLVSWVRQVTSWGRVRFLCRLQMPIGQFTPLSFYQVTLSQVTSYLRRYENGALKKTVGSFTHEPPLAFGTWYKFRFTWFLGYDYQNVPSAYFRLEQMIDGDWVPQGDDLIDPDNTWHDSSINRVGLWFDYRAWYDNTEIHIPS